LDNTYYVNGVIDFLKSRKESEVQKECKPEQSGRTKLLISFKDLDGKITFT